MIAEPRLLTPASPLSRPRSRLAPPRRHRAAPPRSLRRLRGRGSSGGPASRRRGRRGRPPSPGRETVTTRSNSAPRNSSKLLERWPEMSTPLSAIALMARGWTSVGRVPALKTSYRSPCRWRSSPSAFSRAGRVIGADEEDAGVGGGGHGIKSLTSKKRESSI